MGRQLSPEELWELEGMDVRGEFDPSAPRKKQPARVNSLKLDFPE
jgi:hypothetical protein